MSDAKESARPKRKSNEKRSPAPALNKAAGKGGATPPAAAPAAPSQAAAAAAPPGDGAYVNMERVLPEQQRPAEPTPAAADEPANESDPDGNPEPEFDENYEQHAEPVTPAGVSADGGGQYPTPGGWDIVQNEV